MFYLDILLLVLSLSLPHELGERLWRCGRATLRCQSGSNFLANHTFQSKTEIGNFKALTLSIFFLSILWMQSESFML